MHKTNYYNHLANIEYVSLAKTEITGQYPEIYIE